MGINLGLQLYSLRDDVNNDFFGLLEKVAKIGYDGVEFAGFHGIKASDLKKELNRLGLTSTASHTGLDLLRNDLENVIRYNLEIGTKFIICPYAEYKGKNDYLRLAEFLDKTGKRVREEGMVFGYHNHAHEFERFDGKYGLDLLYENMSPENVKCQLDVYWITYAGIDPIRYIRKYSGRCPIIHLKDMKDIESREMIEVGNGTVNIKGTIEAGVAQGTEWFSVEQDTIRMNHLESVRISHDNVRRIAGK